MSRRGFTFIDLFSGIGGFHQAAAACGGRCILACDINAEARSIYQENYGIIPEKDVRTLRLVPPGSCDLLMAGPPCQTYSTIGERRGTADQRGTLIYTVARYIAATKPKTFIIENVKGLTVMPAFHRFLNMVKAAGYSVSWAVLDAANFGVPQHRERVYIIGVLAGQGHGTFDFDPLLITHDRIVFRTIMDRAPDPRLKNHKFDGLPLTNIKTSSGFVLRAKKNNYINNKLFSSHGIVGTLCATFSPIVYDERHKLARQMSPREMLLCQGFPATFKLPPGRSKAMFYTGNAVCVNVVRAIIEALHSSTA